MKTKKVEKIDSCLGFLIPPSFYSQFSERIYQNYDSIIPNKKHSRKQKKQPKI